MSASKDHGHTPPTIKFSPHLDVNVPKPFVEVIVPKPPTDWPTLIAVAISLLLGIFNIWSTRRQISLFEDQNSLAKSVAIVDERPWLTVTTARIDTGLPGMVIHIKNSGKTPALEVRVKLDPVQSEKILPADKFTRDEVQGIGAAQQNIVAPNGEIDSEDASLSEPALPQSIKDKFRELATGATIINGGVSYTDSNKTKGFTRFCFVLRDNRVLMHCLNTDAMD